MSSLKSDLRFCARCGGGLRRERIKGNEPERLVCNVCGTVSYLDPKVVACCLVTRGGRILLLKRAIEPERSKWVLPGGYVDRGEAVSDAAVRELKEECGLTATVDDILGVYSYTGDDNVVVVYIVSAVGGDPVAGDETEEVSWFRPEGIPWSRLAFKSTADALRDYMKGRGKERK